MSLVKGHWRRTSDGKTIWIKEHFRNIKDEPSLFGCGSILGGIILLFGSPYYFLTFMNTFMGTNFMNGSKEINDYIWICIIVFIILLILFIIGMVMNIAIFVYIPVIIILVEIVTFVFALIAGAIEILKMIGNFINSFR